MIMCLWFIINIHTLKDIDSCTHALFFLPFVFSARGGGGGGLALDLNNGSMYVAKSKNEKKDRSHPSALSE